MMGNPDDLILKVELDEEGKTWTVTVCALNGRKVEEAEFILEVECWLSELSQAHNLLSDPSTLIH
jgi:hypothetical protein